MIVLDAILHWLGRPPGRKFSGFLAAALVAALLAHMVWMLNWRGVGIFLLFGFGVPYLAEGLGIRRGIAGARYCYTGWVGPLLPLGVPLYVMIAWVGLLYGVSNIPMASLVWLTAWKGLDAFSVIPCVIISIVTGLAMSAFDTIIDPIAVREGRWTWEKGGLWYGIPYGDFVGWFIVTFLTILPIFLIQVSGLPDSLFNYYPQYLPEYPSPYLIFAPTAMLGLLLLHLAGRAKGNGLAKLAWISCIEGVLTLLIYVGVALIYEVENHSIFIVIERGL